jgi:hypothetical protein
MQLNAHLKLALLHQLDAFRRTKRFKAWLTQSQVAAAVMCNGVLMDYAQSYHCLTDALKQVERVQLTPQEMIGKQGRDIADCLYQKRLGVL